jgi:hypothetical protein
VLRLGLVLVVATLAVYSSAARSGFVSDDHQVIERGRLIGRVANIPQLFTHNAMWNSDGGAFAKEATVDTYRPLTLATFFIERAMFGIKPGPYHLVSVFIHLVNVLLLFALGGRLGLSRLAAAAGALLFAVHPAISEAVHWVNGRSDPLCLLFFLAGVFNWLAWLKRPEGHGYGRMAAVAWLALLATLCKETAFLLAPPLFLLAFHFGARRRALVFAFLPWALGLGAGLLLRLFALRGAAISGGADHLAYAFSRAPLIFRDGMLSFLRLRNDCSLCS